MKQIEKKEVKKEWEEYISEGMEARESKDNSQWLLGDLAMGITVDYGEDSVGKYAYSIGVEKKTLLNYRTIAGRFNKDIRRKYRKLSFSHFACLTKVYSPQAWLEKADNNEWSVNTLRKKLSEQHEIVKEPTLSDEPPRVYRCPECGLWRLKDVSSLEICRGHYKFKDGRVRYI